MMHAASQLDFALAPVASALADPRTEELCVNRPGEFWLRQGGRFERHTAPELNFDMLEGVAILAGALRNQNVGAEHPLCSTDLPSGHRLQVVLPPAVPPGTVSLTFRRPSDTVSALSDLAGRYDTSRWNRWDKRREQRQADSAGLLELFDAGDAVAFFRGLVRARRNVLFCGATGGGKTTLSKTLTSEIPRTERILTIEDALELVVPHGNCVRLLYSKGGLTLGGVTADALLQATLRMRPDRVLLQELRDDAAWVYLNEVMTGHPGSLTTIHGADAPQAMRRLFNLVKGTPQGATYGDDTLAAMIGSAVDAIVPLHNDAGTYSIREVWFADDAARRGEVAADLLRAA
ncbi:P-type DNA transfer ATPase VirB11 [Paeniroseomonas aquatica]|uniref:Type IV secretion system protein n=1 Tax=Paeniroseomonas aquatica TaxID=373043 RepID=A0ABT8A5B4_9PROT|nr:P-type DNA transfer ATPase VirB11 [Paeniroseomonas aquatica]MDN3564876.1 P-type DNA transfer ATPase VirB11 [Paeniroseomonas aquatica]